MANLILLLVGLVLIGAGLDLSPEARSVIYLAMIAGFICGYGEGLGQALRKSTKHPSDP